MRVDAGDRADGTPPLDAGGSMASASGGVPPALRRILAATRSTWTITVASDLALLAPALGFRSDFGSQAMLERVSSVSHVLWPSKDATDLASTAFGIGATHVACGLWCCAVLGRIAWRNLHGRADEAVLGVLVPIPDVAAGRYVGRRWPVPLVRWRDANGAMMRTWPGVVAGIALGVAISVWTPPLPGGLTWSPTYYGGTGRTTEHRPVPAWKVDPSSPLGVAGVRNGDVIETVDGRPATSLQQLGVAVWSGYGRRIELGFLRSGEGGPRTVAVSVPVGEKPSRSESAGRRGDIGDLRGLFDWGPTTRGMSPARRAEALIEDGTTYARILMGLEPVENALMSSGPGQWRTVGGMLAVSHFAGAVEAGTLWTSGILAVLSLPAWGVGRWRRRRRGVSAAEDGIRDAHADRPRRRLPLMMAAAPATMAPA